MLQVEINDVPGHVVALRKPTYLIGRSNVCNLRVSDDSLQLVHARVKVVGEGVTLTPQADAVIKLNDVALAGEAQLHPGDRVTLGKTELVVRDAVEDDVSEAEADGIEPSASRSIDPDSQEHGKQRSHDQTQGVVEEPGEQTQEWLLFGLNSASRSKSFSVNSSVVLGRGRACDLQLSEAHLSRQHARLTPTADGLVVEDLDSANGTYVNGRRVVKAVLKNGDELSLDTIKFRVAQPQQGSATDETIVQAGRIRQASQQAQHSPNAAQRGDEKRGSGDKRQAHSAQEPADKEPAQQNNSATQADDEPASADVDEAPEPHIRPPKGPSAIEIQRAALMRMKEDGELPLSAQRHAGASSQSRESGSRWPIMALVLVLAGAAWAATRFFGVPTV